MPPGIVLACTLQREDARDALILGAGCGAPDAADPFACLPAGAVIGTSSVRRQAQMLHARPDLASPRCAATCRPGSAKLAAGECAASLLAYAGLKRLGLADRASVVLDPEAMVPGRRPGHRRHHRAARTTANCANCSRPSRTPRRRRSPPPNARCWGGWTAPAARRSAAMPGCCRMAQLHLTGLVARADGSFLLKRACRGGGGCGADRHRTGRTACAPTARRPLCLRGEVPRTWHSSSMPDAGPASWSPAGARCGETARRVAALGWRPILAPALVLAPRRLAPAGGRRRCC